MADSKTSLISGSRPTPPAPVANTLDATNEAVYHDSAQSPTAWLTSYNKFINIRAGSIMCVMALIIFIVPDVLNPGRMVDMQLELKIKLLQVLFVGLVVVMVLISISLSIYRGSDVKENGGMYFMLGISLIGFALIEIIMIIFTRHGDLPKGKTWFLYFVGFCVMLESIFTDVLVFQ